MARLPVTLQRKFTGPKEPACFLAAACAACGMTWTSVGVQRYAGWVGKKESKVGGKQENKMSVQSACIVLAKSPQCQVLIRCAGGWAGVIFLLLSANHAELHTGGRERARAGGRVLSRATHPFLKSGVREESKTKANAYRERKHKTHSIRATRKV